jgi:hypothetical protein
VYGKASSQLRRFGAKMLSQLCAKRLTIDAQVLF